MNKRDERAIYIEEVGTWFKHDSIFFGGVQAASYPEAFEKLYGHAPIMPPPVRTPRKEVLA